MSKTVVIIHRLLASMALAFGLSLFITAAVARLIYLPRPGSHGIWFMLAVVWLIITIVLFVQRKFVDFLSA